jgi:hypothetical protein
MHSISVSGTRSSALSDPPKKLIRLDFFFARSPLRGAAPSLARRRREETYYKGEHKNKIGRLIIIQNSAERVLIWD